MQRLRDIQRSIARCRCMAHQSCHCNCLTPCHPCDRQQRRSASKRDRLATWHTRTRSRACHWRASTTPSRHLGPARLFFAAWPTEALLCPPEGRAVQRKRGGAASRGSAAVPQRHPGGAPGLGPAGGEPAPGRGHSLGRCRARRLELRGGGSTGCARDQLPFQARFKAQNQKV